MPADTVSDAFGDGVPTDGAEVLGTLSPSRAQDFLNCALAFRFRRIDRLPEPPSPYAVRGSVVHLVLEQLFDLPPDRRTTEGATALLAPAWATVREREPEVAQLFADPEAEETWLGSAAEVLARWFDLENPQRLEPAEREVYVESVLASGLMLRGIVDRVDVAPDGAVRIVDYKTGSAPPVDFEQRALFQMRFYALVWWRLRGVLPSMLQLVYLGNGEILRYQPQEVDLRATERKVEAISAAIRAARESGDWQPNPGRLCGGCAFRPLCPAFGGTPPPLPVE